MINNFVTADLRNERAQSLTMKEFLSGGKGVISRGGVMTQDILLFQKRLQLNIMNDLLEK